MKGAHRIIGWSLLLGGFAAPAFGAAPEEEYVVVGTIYGSGDQRVQPVAVIRDSVSKQTLVLKVGECLPRHPRFCIASVDRSEVYATDGRTRMTIHRDPFDSGSSSSGGAEIASNGGGPNNGGPNNGGPGYDNPPGGGFAPPPPPPPQVESYEPPPQGDGGFPELPPPPPPGVNYPAPPGDADFGNPQVGAGGGRDAQWVDDPNGPAGGGVGGPQGQQPQRDGLAEMYEYINRKVQRGERLDPYEEAMLRSHSEPAP